ncbi:MAG: mechanosensitive ion channel family protein [Bryobacteraceae bacterium]
MSYTKFFIPTTVVCALCAAAWAQAPAASAPVIVEGRTLFTVQTNLGPFTAQDRAQAASERIARVSKDLTARLDAIAAVKGDTSTDIALADRVLLTVTEADAKAAGKSRDQLAESYVKIIQSSVAGIRSEYSTRSLLEGSLFAFLITLALIGLLMLLRRLRSVAVTRLETAQMPPIRIQQVELVSTNQSKQYLIQATKAGRLLLVVIALYVYIPLVLSFFPWTRKYSPVLVDYVVAPLRSARDAFLAYLPSLFVVILCAAGAYFLVRISHFLFRELGKGTITWPGFHLEWAQPTHKLLRFLILAFTLVVVFPYLPGSGSPAFQGVSIFLGILFSLGSTSAVANIIGGVILTYSRAFQLGDRIKIADTTGDVVEKTLLATRIRTIKNEFITIPNSMVLSSHIVNFSSPEGGSPLILHTSITIGYDAPWRQVQDLLTAAASRTALILKDPAPFVLQTSLDDFYVTYQINAYTADGSRMAVIYAELHQNIQDCFNESGVEIMSPHYGSLRDGNATTVPAQYLPSGYAAPRFRFDQNRDKRDAAVSR